MIYPAYIHLGDEKHAHGVTLPDFDGCFTSADDYNDLHENVQEAIELYFEGEELEIPEPSDISDLEKSGDYKGGIWMLFDVDVLKLNSKPVRLNISMPGHVVKRIDDFAESHHLNRSAFLVAASEKYISQASPRA